MATTSGSVGQLAGLGSRLVAFLVDIIFTSVVGGILTVPLIVLLGGGDAVVVVGVLVQLFLVLVVFAYFVLMEGIYGYTVGKKLLSIRVVDESGGKIGIGKSAIRNVLRIVDGLPFAYILGVALIALNDDEQRVGDMVASTYVVKG